ncbi:MAG: carbamoyltransferase C-terminal domain-containing protein [Candidatus Sumerlaeaceae bacterium]
MITLGVTDGHTATACLMRDGKLLGMVSEERFNRKKGWAGFPVQSVDWLLQNNDVRPADLDFVTVSSLVQPMLDLGSADRSLLRRMVRLASRLASSAVTSPAVVKNYVNYFSKRRDLEPVKEFLRRCGQQTQLRVVEHHTTHAATAYYPSPFFSPDEKMLVITLDGSGDGLCGTVSIGEKFGLTRLAALPSYHSIGDFYMRLTQYMAMKPLEHEYKVMGLAPYAPEEWADKAYAVMKEFYGLTADGLGFENRTGRWSLDLVPYIEEKMRGHRFDCVAAAAQRLVEEVVVPFVRNWVKTTGIRKVGCAGGVFMNVKMNMLISQLPEIEQIFFMPSGGDESTAYGAALHTYAEDCVRAGATPEIQPLEQLYLGPEFNDEAALAELQKNTGTLEWMKPADLPGTAAQLLVDNMILARMVGRAEFGARSLGNRTIIANPSDPRNVRNINRAIKMRDFWMPFCPTVLAERRHDYTVNPKDIPARYMVNAFESTPLAFRELVCGLHPFDLTCRPQFISELENPGWYALVKAFEKRTGIGGVMNTSFNLHGEPIVGTPADAISTLVRSEIDYLILGSYLVWKKGHRERPEAGAA